MFRSFDFLEQSNALVGGTLHKPHGRIVTNCICGSADSSLWIEGLIDLYLGAAFI
jgi:hypothetical protein